MMIWCVQILQNKVKHLVSCIWGWASTQWVLGDYKKEYSLNNLLQTSPAAHWDPNFRGLLSSIISYRLLQSAAGIPASEIGLLQIRFYFLPKLTDFCPPFRVWYSNRTLRSWLTAEAYDNRKKPAWSDEFWRLRTLFLHG